MQVDSGAAAGAGMMVHGGEAGLAGSGGGDRAVDFGSDNPMENLSLAEFTREMKLDADRQQGLVPIVAKLLLKLVEFNDKLPLEKDHITVFHAQKAPAVSVMDYSERIAKYSSCSYCCFVVGVIYMDRFIQQQRVMQKVCVCIHTGTHTYTHTHTHTQRTHCMTCCYVYRSAFLLLCSVTPNHLVCRLSQFTHNTHRCTHSHMHNI